MVAEIVAVLAVEIRRLSKEGKACELSDGTVGGPPALRISGAHCGKPATAYSLRGCQWNSADAERADSQ